MEDPSPDDARAAARAELWKRYDAGAVTPAEVETRLRMIDRAGDAAAAGDALTAPLALHRRVARSTAVAAGVVAVAVVGLGVGAVVAGTGSGSPLGGGRAGVGTTGVPPQAGEVVIEPVAPQPVPVPGGDCDALAELRDAQAAAGGDPSAQPTSPGLLSDPPFVPEGYEHGDDFDVVPGSDTDVAMGIAAGNPLPVEILGRELDGPLPVRMRAFRYESFDVAATAGEEGPRQALCTYGGERVDDPDRPGIFTVVLVDAPIPPTAFSGFHRGDRRFSVMVEAASTEPEALDAAAELAAQIAHAELVATGVAPLGTTDPDGAPHTTSPDEPSVDTTIPAAAGAATRPTADA